MVHVPKSLALEGFLDSLLQSFENCRPALKDGETEDAVEAYFLAVYEKETARLRDILRVSEAHLTPEARAEYLMKVDDLVRKVVVPAYARLARDFTRRERNAFYVVNDPLHGLERLGLAALGILLGVLSIRAPFIPLWAKEWVLVFGLGGLLMPDLRAWLANRNYEGQLNGLVKRADQEVLRIGESYLTSGASLAEREAKAAAASAASLSAERNGSSHG